MLNTGVTHPEPHWLSQLAPGGRIMVPLTAAMDQSAAAHPAGAAMGNISKGLMILITGTDRADQFDARILTFVAIYSALGLRDDAVNGELRTAMAKMPFAPLKHFRLDPHEPDATCWCHTTRGCWSTS